jgi:hypothetical protein
MKLNVDAGHFNIIIFHSLYLNFLYNYTCKIIHIKLVFKVIEFISNKAFVI